MRRFSIWICWARLVKLETAGVSIRTGDARGVHTMVDLPPELWAHDGGEYLGQDAHPSFLVHDVQLLESLAHRPRQDMVRLQEPPPARAVLLRRRACVSVSRKEDDLVLVALQQVVLFGQAGEDIGQERVEVRLVRVGHGCRVQNEDGPALPGRHRRAVQNGSRSLCHVGRIIRALSRRRDG